MISVFRISVIRSIKSIKENLEALSIKENVVIRSIKKNFENFKMFLNSISFTFSIIYFSETWQDETNSTENSLYELPNYMTSSKEWLKRWLIV